MRGTISEGFHGRLYFLGGSFLLLKDHVKFAVAIDPFHPSSFSTICRAHPFFLQYLFNPRESISQN
jgi:hypothetical protein